jgi:hypothetical protein
VGVVRGAWRGADGAVLAVRGGDGGLGGEGALLFEGTGASVETGWDAVRLRV